MYTVDIHSNKETVEDAIEQLNVAIRMAKREKDKLLCVITGYGSGKGSTHKIKSAVVNYLEENKNGSIKGYLLGEHVDIFNVEYQKCTFSNRIPEAEKKSSNPGKIYIAV